MIERVRKTFLITTHYLEAIKEKNINLSTTKSNFYMTKI